MFSIRFPASGSSQLPGGWDSILTPPEVTGGSRSRISISECQDGVDSYNFLADDWISCVGDATHHISD